MKMGMSKAEAEDKVLTQNSGFWKFSCQVLYFWYSTWHSAIPFFFSPHCKMDILLLFWSEAEFFFLLSSIFSMLVSFMRGIAELYNDIVVVFFFFFFFNNAYFNLSAVCKKFLYYCFRTQQVRRDTEQLPQLTTGVQWASF